MAGWDTGFGDLNEMQGRRGLLSRLFNTRQDDSPLAGDFGAPGSWSDPAVYAQRASGTLRNRMDADTTRSPGNEGAPADFGGPVFPNSRGAQISEDTASGIDPTRLPKGVTFSRDNWRGSMPADISNPPRTELLGDGMTLASTGGQTPGDFANQAPGMAQSLRAQMAGAMRGANQTDSPSRLEQMQSEYDALAPQKPSLKQQLLRALAAGIQGGYKPSGISPEQWQQNQLTRSGQEQQREEFDIGQRNQERSRLLQEMEAERRMQEQEDLATQRMTLQERMQAQRERAAQESQGRLFGQQNQLEATREQARQAAQTQAQQASEERQNRMFAEQQKLEGMRERAADARALHATDTRSETLANKRYETAMDAEQRLSRMEASYQKGLKGDQQAMLALLTDHIGMTLGMQKGARITKDILNEAQQSMPWLAKVQARFDDRGYLSGVVLSPQQMQQMLELGYGARDRAVQGAYDDSQLYGVQPPKGAAAVFGKRKMGDMPAIQQGGGQGGGATHVYDPVTGTVKPIQ